MGVKNSSSDAPEVPKSARARAKASSEAVRSSQNTADAAEDTGAASCKADRNEGRDPHTLIPVGFDGNPSRAKGSFQSSMLAANAERFAVMNDLSSPTAESQSLLQSQALSGTQGSMPARLPSPDGSMEDVGEVTLSVLDRDKMLFLLDKDKVQGYGGFRSVRATHGFLGGSYYFEVERIPVNTLVYDSVQEGIDLFFLNEDNKNPDQGHVRVGFSTKWMEADLPVGADRNSYGIRDVTGEFFHDSSGTRYGQSFKAGDVLGVRLTMPLETLELKETPKKLITKLEFDAELERLAGMRSPLHGTAEWNKKRYAWQLTETEELSKAFSDLQPPLKSCAYNALAKYFDMSHILDRNATEHIKSGPSPGDANQVSLMVTVPEGFARVKEEPSTKPHATASQQHIGETKLSPSCVEVKDESQIKTEAGMATAFGLQGTVAMDTSEDRNQSVRGNTNTNANANPNANQDQTTATVNDQSYQPDQPDQPDQPMPDGTNQNIHEQSIIELKSEPTDVEMKDTALEGVMTTEDQILNANKSDFPAGNGNKQDEPNIDDKGQASPETSAGRSLPQAAKGKLKFEFEPHKLSLAEVALLSERRYAEWKYWYLERGNVQNPLLDILDRDAELEFYLNGEPMNRDMVALKGLPVGRYFATISLYRSVAVRVNFGPDFKYPCPPNARPYSELADQPNLI